MFFASSGPLGGPLEDLLGRLGALLDRLEAILGHLGTVLDSLGVSWSALGPSWRPLGALWGRLGGLWSRPGPKKPPTWPPEGVLEPGPARERKERFRNLTEITHTTVRTGSLGVKTCLRQLSYWEPWW